MIFRGGMRAKYSAGHTRHARTAYCVCMLPFSRTMMEVAINYRWLNYNNCNSA